MAPRSNILLLLDKDHFETHLETLSCEEDRSSRIPHALAQGSSARSMVSPILTLSSSRVSDSSSLPSRLFGSLKRTFSKKSTRPLMPLQPNSLGHSPRAQMGSGNFKGASEPYCPSVLYAERVYQFTDTGSLFSDFTAMNQDAFETPTTAADEHLDFMAQSEEGPHTLRIKRISMPQDSDPQSSGTGSVNPWRQSPAAGHHSFVGKSAAYATTGKAHPETDHGLDFTSNEDVADPGKSSYNPCESLSTFAASNEHDPGRMKVESNKAWLNPKATCDESPVPVSHPNWTMSSSQDRHFDHERASCIPYVLTEDCNSEGTKAKPMPRTPAAQRANDYVPNTTAQFDNSAICDTLKQRRQRLASEMITDSTLNSWSSDETNHSRHLAGMDISDLSPDVPVSENISVLQDAIIDVSNIDDDSRSVLVDVQINRDESIQASGMSSKLSGTTVPFRHHERPDHSQNISYRAPPLSCQTKEQKRFSQENRMPSGNVKSCIQGFEDKIYRNQAEAVRKSPGQTAWSRDCCDRTSSNIKTRKHSFGIEKAVDSQFGAVEAAGRSPGSHHDVRS